MAMQEETATPTRSVRAVLADARRLLEIYGWMAPRVRRYDFEAARSILEVLADVTKLDPVAYRAALEDIAVGQGWLPGILPLIGLADLEALVTGWENDRYRTLAEVLEVMS